MIKLWFICIVSLGLFISGCRQNDPLPHVPEVVDFNFHVRPILVQNCYLCHGPDPSSRQADLRLDTFDGATALLKNGKGHAIIPGDADRSEAIRRISSSDIGVMMPPPESNLQLSDYEIAVLRKWIDQGAKWKKHWAFIPPEENGESKAENHIDHFIDEKLKTHALKPAGEAGRTSLIRRVSYVLTGLPPTIDEIQAFLSDETDKAYEQMVDRYLNSSGFGERWARHWLDVVRYAETKGHEFDYEIVGAWHYRDYLIRAFNADVPYDQLLKEHLAGDLLKDIRWNDESGNNESQLGTSFFVFGEGTHSPVDIRKDEADRIDNMIDVTSKTFQGLTVSCARCHDHKFDPIPTADYYALYGVMESSRFSPIPVDLTYEKIESLEEIEKIKTTIRSTLEKQFPPTSQRQTNGMDTTSFDMLGDFRGPSLDNWKSDGLAFGSKSTLGQPVWSADKKLLKFEKGRASSRHLTNGVYGALRSPNFEINRDFIGVRATGKSSTIRVIIDNFQLIQWPIYGGLEHKVDTGSWKNFTFDVSAWKGRKAYVEVLPGSYRSHVYALDPEAYVEVEYAIAYDGNWPLNVDSFFKEAINWVASLNKQLMSDAHTLTTSLKHLHEKQEQETSIPEDSLFFTGITEGFGVNSPVSERGSHKNELATVVPRGFLSALTEDHQFESDGSGRLELANAMLDPANPLTSRVMVNRIWHHLFGRGIVETVDNFGLQGKLPTHPELLDHLAIKFQEDQWSIKRMIKYIVMSRTFRRATEAENAALEQDPDNLWLSHFPVRRLEAEAIRDGILATSGQLNTKMYGQPVPVYLTEFMTGRGRPARSGPLDGLGRRSIYLSVRRNFLEPMMTTFDRPIPFSTFGKRNVTNVPAQSLILMNDPFVIDQAQKMAADVLEQEGLTTEERIELIYLRALSRKPEEQEMEQARKFLTLIADSYQVDSEETDQNLSVWKDYCHSVFNLKEFIYLI